MARLVIPPIKTPIAHPRKQPIILPPQLDPSCVLCLLPICNTKWRDFSGKNNHGTVTGATWTSKGRLGPALYFDGYNDYVEVADADSLNVTTGITVEIWVNPTTKSSWKHLINKRSATQGHYMLYDNSPDELVIFTVKVGNVSKTAYSNLGIPVNTWTHLVGTYDRIRTRLYVDAVEQTVGTNATGTIDVTTNPLRIGRSSYDGSYSNGFIDEVRIHNRALELDEIKGLYEIGRVVRS